MKCPKCGCPVNEHPFMRVNEKGVKGVFWCQPCIEKHEPELYKNLKEEETQVEKDLIKIFY